MKWHQFLIAIIVLWCAGFASAQCPYTMPPIDCPEVDDCGAGGFRIVGCEDDACAALKAAMSAVVAQANALCAAGEPQGQIDAWIAWAQDDAYQDYYEAMDECCVWILLDQGPPLMEPAQGGGSTGTLPPSGTGSSGTLPPNYALDETVGTLPAFMVFAETAWLLPNGNNDWILTKMIWPTHTAIEPLPLDVVLTGRNIVVPVAYSEYGTEAVDCTGQGFTGESLSSTVVGAGGVSVEVTTCRASNWSRTQWIRRHRANVEAVTEELGGSTEGLTGPGYQTFCDDNRGELVYGQGHMAAQLTVRESFALLVRGQNTADIDVGLGTLCVSPINRVGVAASAPNALGQVGWSVRGVGGDPVPGYYQVWYRVDPEFWPTPESTVDFTNGVHLFGE